MSKLSISVMLMLCGAHAVFADDCTLGERYANLAAKSTAAYEARDALDFLNHAVDVCPTFSHWMQLGDAAMALAPDQDAAKRGAEAFVAAYAVASTPEQQANSAAKYAQLLINNGDPQHAVIYIYYAKNLMPSVPWINGLADRIAKRNAEFKSDEIRRGLGDVIFKPLRLADARSSPKPMSADIAPVTEPALTASVNTAADAHVLEIPIHFLYDSTEVDPKNAQNVATLAHVLAESQYARNRFTFVGHSDLRGEASYDRALSLRRAVSLQRQVILIEPSLTGRIETIGRGKDQPLSWGFTEQEQWVNRRLEVAAN